MNTVPLTTKDNKNFYLIESSGKVFTSLSLLICSIFMFNVLGELDEESFLPILDIKNII
jgi:hypothetical protein